MGKVRLAILSIVICSGCQTAQLKHATVVQAPSVTEIYYQQILANVAMHYADPTALPFFSLPQQGTNTTQLSLTIGYTPTFDLITSAGRYLGSYLFDKQGASISGADTNIQAWTSNPTVVPDRLLLMQYAYENAFGAIEQSHYDDLVNVLDYYHNNSPKAQRKALQDKMTKTISGYEEMKKNNLITDVEFAKMKNDLERQTALDDFLLSQKESSLTQFSPRYSLQLHSGWFGVGTCHQVPKGACYVGHYGKTYAWVLPGHESELADFALVILNLATYSAPDREPRNQAAPSQGRAAK